ncbi:MAG: hypothetical protein JSS07_05425 [Proteobacteria bacterium]|nr:hypothetical protein [Pseudomonadota bacterium]
MLKQMNLKESFVNRLTRHSIPFIIAVIVGIYYLSEIRPFPYEHYEKYINELQRYDAELNESIVLIRFGALRYYNPIVQSQDGTSNVLSIINDLLKNKPNPTIEAKLNTLQKTIEKKRELTDKFELINPILLNAILNFSTILSQIIESESNTQLVESCLEKDYKSQQIDKANNLFRGILIYVSHRTEEKRTDLTQLVDDLKSAPEKLPKLDLALVYADKILEYQPQMSKIDEELFQVPVVAQSNQLQQTFNQEFQNFQALGDKFRIILYILVFTLLLVLRWLFSRLQNTVVSLNVEVVEKVKAQNALAETNRQLENRVAQRTHELTVKNSDLNQALSDLKDAQDQLIMQEKMASVGMLTTGIAHEIKNPLNFVNNFSDISVELVKELDEELKSNQEKLPPETTKYIEEILQDLKTNCAKIKEHGVRADNIVKNMLLHSQASGVQKEMIDLKTLMDDNIKIALESFKASAQHFEVKIDKQYDEKLEKILAAPQAIGRLFIYILDNSFYALREKQLTQGQNFTPTLTIVIKQITDAVLIKIKDNGTGISKKSLDKVFEPFFTTKPTGKGNTGLGLSICYDTVVKQHKGELKVTSEEGVFTEFTVVLPTGSKKSGN